MLDKYRLELHWTKLDKKNDSRVYLVGAYFSGPVLADAEQINDDDHIQLDFTKQFSRLISSYYFAKLHWKKVTYEKDTVLLGDAYFESEFIYDLNTIGDSDYVIIDTTQHDGEAHVYSLVYEAKIVNSEGVERNYD